jgi:hypothetical protein
MRRRRPPAGRPPASRPSRHPTAFSHTGLPFAWICLATLPFAWICLAGTTCGRLPRAGLIAVAVGLGLGVLAGCGTSGTARTTGAASARTCGTTRTGANVPVIITVDRGSASCATALRVENSYAAVIRTGQIRGTGGGAPVRVSGWTCQGFPTPEVLRTGQTSVCRDGGAEVLAVLPPPSAAP